MQKRPKKGCEHRLYQPFFTAKTAYRSSDAQALATRKNRISPQSGKEGEQQSCTLYPERKIYDIVEKRYGVNREIVAAILLKETRLGRIALKHDSFYVFDTLLRKLRDDTPRNRRLLAMARSNAAAIVEFCYTNGIEPQACRLPASYAGAVGIAQFMPSSFSYAVSSAPDRAPDLTDMKDAILSTANYLHKKAGFTKLLDWSKVGDMRAIEDAWYAYDFTRKNASFAYEKQNRRYYDCFTCKSKKFAYIRDYAKKIMRYNNASNYAVGVLRLAYEARR